MVKRIAFLLSNTGNPRFHEITGYLTRLVDEGILDEYIRSRDVDSIRRFESIPELEDIFSKATPMDTVLIAEIKDLSRVYDVAKTAQKRYKMKAFGIYEK